jgi:hypothetical protein
LAPTTFDRRQRWDGPGKVNNWRMHELDQYLLGRPAGVPSGQLVKETVSAARLNSTGYAAAWGLKHFLAKHHRVALSGYLRKCSEIRPLEGATQFVPPGICPQNLVEFREAFGEDFAELEKKMFDYWRTLPYVAPFADKPHYVAAIAVPSGRRPQRWAGVFLTQELAEKWQSQRLEALPQDQQAVAKSSIVQLPNRRAAEAQQQQFLRGP